MKNLLLNGKPLMMRNNMNLKTNDPVMWRKKEYKFVRYVDVNDMEVWREEHGFDFVSDSNSERWGIIQAKGQGSIHPIPSITVDVSELDLIMEFDFTKDAK